MINIDLSIKKKKTINVFRVSHKVVDNDTIDINFGIVNVTTKRKVHFNHGLKFRKAEFTIGCGGTSGRSLAIDMLQYLNNKHVTTPSICHNRFC